MLVYKGVSNEKRPVEACLYYLINRYYDPETHRFLTIDSFEYLDIESISGIDLYAYCGNNPVMYFDGDEYSNLFNSSSTGMVATGGTSENVSQKEKRSVISWLKLASIALPDIITAGKYFSASNIHKYIGYSKNTRYVFPKLDGTWRYIAKSKSGFFSNSSLIFKQILAKDARAGFGAIAKSFGFTVGVNAIINFGSNLYENNWHIDGAMLKDTLIDTAIGVGSYYLAAGIVSGVSAGLLAIGVSISGGVVVVGVVALSVGIEWLLRELIDYKD